MTPKRKLYALFILSSVLAAAAGVLFAVLNKPAYAETLPFWQMTDHKEENPKEFLRVERQNFFGAAATMNKDKNEIPFTNDVNGIFLLDKNTFNVFFFGQSN
ncbi:MAG: hypothetical protein FWE82_02835 [Defluviitaleaceae bacterium]|nr:hypothetical protein [Defluviitaleaceae bacterium]